VGLLFPGSVGCDVADIFISYSKKQPQLTRDLAAYLMSQGYSVWWDTDLTAGETFREAIDRELNAAKAVIVIWTAHSVASKWVIAEVEHADRERKLIPLRTRDLDIQYIPKPYGTYHSDIVDDHQAILKAVRRVLTPAQPDSASAEAGRLGSPHVTPKSERNLPGAGLRLRIGGLLLIGTAAGLLATLVWKLQTGTVERIERVAAGTPPAAQPIPNAAPAPDAASESKAVSPVPTAPAILAAPAVPAAPVDPCGGPVTASFPSQCAAPLTAEQQRGLKPKDTFRECADCPEMVVVPAGSFTMGSPESEAHRDSWEGPQHTVAIDKAFAAGKLHVTVDQYKAFVQAAGYEKSRLCDWRRPGFVQEGSHPAVCVSWDDAMAYVGWLARKTGKPYHLLSEAEWEYAARGRTQPGNYPRFWFGNEEQNLCRYANGPGSCDGYEYTSPAGHYLANAFGLYDMAGNAGQWTADCWNNDYNGAPADGAAWTIGNCSGRVVRGGSWRANANSWNLRAAARGWSTSESNSNGFRVARTLTP
jgi:formylglycine-generating enzyme required for sulfatase activity